ncbi:MAG TPA: class I SAM-dependent methyltransferase, partial [Flavisolibacter sp.]|nr:class I SAM-dependent methyltransferase [Flavisolibacter sp.]
MKDPVDHTGFEERYLALRRREGRLYSNEEVALLPNIRATHPLKKEWAVRRKSCQRLVRFLKQKKRPLCILEVGCGNGWLCHQLSKIPSSSVTGIDVNETELDQARRVFPSLRFIHADLNIATIQEQFDVIVFAASFQYFSLP